MFDNYFTAAAVLYYSSLVVYNEHGRRHGHQGGWQGGGEGGQGRWSDHLGQSGLVKSCFVRIHNLHFAKFSVIFREGDQKKRGNFSVNLAKSWINLVLQYEMIIDTCAPAIPQLTAFWAWITSKIPSTQMHSSNDSKLLYNALYDLHAPVLHPLGNILHNIW